MITDSIITMFMGVTLFFIDLLPVIDLEVATQISNNVLSYIHMASYFVPLETIVAIFVLQVSFEVLKITIAAIKLIIHVIPLW